MKLASYKKQDGFSLVELMVAMAITSILIIIVVGMTSVAINFLKESRNDVVAARSSRPVLMTLSTDLESMHYRTGNNFEWLYASKDPYLLQRNMKMGPNERRSPNAVQLMFFSSAPDRSSSVDSMGNELKSSTRLAGGDVNLIAYRLVYRDQILDEEATKDSPGYPIFSLYRNVIPAEATYAGGQGGGPLLGQRELSNAYSSRERSETDPSNFLAENIIEFTLAFEVEYQSRGGGGGGIQGSDRSIKTIPILAAKGGVNVSDADEFRLKGNGITVRGSAGSEPGISSGRLSAVCVCMTVVTEEGMALIDRVRKNPQAQSPLEKKEFFAKYTRNYTTRIPITRP